MKIINNSDEYSAYTIEEHIENLKRLAALKKQAAEFGTGTSGVDQMLDVAIKTASDAGMSNEDISSHSQESLETIVQQTSEK
jgi:hypothetical protein